VAQQPMEETEMDVENNAGKLPALLAPPLNVDYSVLLSYHDRVVKSFIRTSTSIPRAIAPWLRLTVALAYHSSIFICVLKSMHHAIRLTHHVSHIAHYPAHLHTCPLAAYSISSKSSSGSVTGRWHIKSTHT
jgi:hypothetical protein